MKRALHTHDLCLVLPSSFAAASSASLYRALFAACVPVLFVSFLRQLPFSRFVDWASFSVVVRVEELFHDASLLALLRRLLALRSDRPLLAQLRRRGALAGRLLFDWERLQWPSPYHLTLLELLYSTAGQQWENRSMAGPHSRASRLCERQTPWDQDQ
mmetsp:Transcript_4019/g.6021  ORF Transcript_4019/g.6021 Transcript_4019/m.6021 type:complete len:158 (-) Transcript_4019:124-597(-)